MGLNMITDEDIKTKVVDHFYWDDRVDASNIKVKVDNAIVTLEGKVPTYRAKRAAFSDAWLIVGVAAVNNKLNVEYAIEVVPTDDEILSNARNLLIWDPDIDSTKIDLNVESGRVTLSGTVDAYWKKLVIEGNIENIAGVTDIEDNIAIVPTKRPSDEIIAENLTDAFERNLWIDPDSINIRVKNGIVDLKGIVQDRLERDEAVDSAAYTQGVVDVNSTKLEVAAES